jgi:hypothetical protein
VRRHAVLLVAILGLSAFAGCDGGSGETAGDGATTIEEATGETQTGETAPPTEAGPIVFGVSGGIEGRNDSLVVEPGGAATATDGLQDLESTDQLSDEEVAELYALLDETGLFTEDRRYEGDIVDDFAFSVTYRGVTISGDSFAAPEELLPALGRLSGLLDSILGHGEDGGVGTDFGALEFTLSPVYESGPGPETIVGLLHLQVDQDGQVHGTLAVVRDAGPGLVEVTGSVDADSLALAPGVVRVPPDATLQWDTWELTPVDSDGDGEVDGADGRVVGNWTEFIGDVVEGGGFEATLTTQPDRTQAQVVIDPPSTREFLLPTDEVYIAFNEPLRDRDVNDEVTVLADGEVVDGTLQAAAISGGLATAWVFTPSGQLPFEAEVTLDLGDLRDPAGNPVVSGGAVMLAPDPGPIVRNSGFEAGLDGWIPSGTVGAVESFEGLAPEEGEAFAVVREQSSLAGYLDVPADAETLEFTVTVFSEANMFDVSSSAVISLAPGSGSEVVIFDAAGHENESVACDECTTEVRERIGPLRQSIDVTPYQGQRVFVIVDVRSAFFFGVNFFAVVLDDLRLE